MAINELIIGINLLKSDRKVTKFLKICIFAYKCRYLMLNSTKQKLNEKISEIIVLSNYLKK